MKYIKTAIWWMGTIPVVIAFWAVIVTGVNFQDHLIFVMDTVTVETVTEFSVKIDTLWADYEKRNR